MTLFNFPISLTLNLRVIFSENIRFRNLIGLVNFYVEKT